MKKRFSGRMIGVGLTVTLFATLLGSPAAESAPQHRELPPQWMPLAWKAGLAGTQQWAVGADRSIVHGGTASGHLVRVGFASGGTWGLLEQPIRADRYRGQRVRLSVWVRTRVMDARTGRAVVWMIPDAMEAPIDFSGLGQGVIEGNHDWTRIQAILDVPEGASGILLVVAALGPMQEMWVDDASFEVIAPELRDGPIMRRSTTPLSVGAQQYWAQMPPAPENLDFEQLDFRLASTLLSASWATSQPVDTAPFNRCASTSADDDRLICFDLLAAEITGGFGSMAAALDSGPVFQCQTQLGEADRLSCYDRFAATPNPLGSRAAGPQPYQDITFPRQIAGAAPEYPAELRSAGIQGTADVSFAIDASGHVLLRSLMVRSVTDQRFLDAVWRVLPTYRYTPPLVDGHPSLLLLRKTYEWKRGQPSPMARPVPTLSGVWEATSGVTFAPWTIELHADSGIVDGTADHNGFDAAIGAEAMRPPVWLSGSMTGSRLTVQTDTVWQRGHMSPLLDRRVTLNGVLEGDSIVFTRQVEVKAGSNPGGSMFGVQGATTFTVRRVAHAPDTAIEPQPRREPVNGMIPQ